MYEWFTSENGLEYTAYRMIYEEAYLGMSKDWPWVKFQAPTQAMAKQGISEILDDLTIFERVVLTLMRLWYTLVGYPRTKEGQSP